MQSFSTVLRCACLVALGACATAPKPSAERRSDNWAMEQGTTYLVAVDNQSACTATVRLGSTAISNGTYVGSVPAHSKETFVVTPTHRGRISAYGLEPTGRMCDNLLDSRVRVSITKQG